VPPSICITANDVETFPRLTYRHGVRKRVEVMDALDLNWIGSIRIFVSFFERIVTSRSNDVRLQASTTGVYLQYATSTFGYHSLLGTV
jgi:hypothetical protein